MRAVIADHPGPPSVLRAVDLPDPQPSAGEVVVAVEVAAIIFIDTQMRAGTSPRSPGPFPLVLGNGVGGRVIAVGADVDDSWLGVEVVTSTGGSGGYASLAVAAVPDVHHLPDGMELQAGVALLADGRTAVGLFTAAQIVDGDTVVVTAAAGGLGSLLVQLATSAGARVIALAGSAAKLEFTRSMGAPVAIDYRSDDWESALDLAAPEGVDVVFDGVGGGVSRALIARTHRGSRYVVHGASSGSWAAIDNDDAARRGVEIVPLWSIGNTPASMYEMVERAFAHAVAGELQPTVGQWFPLERAADAHAAIEQRITLGKTLLIV